MDVAKLEELTLTEHEIALVIDYFDVPKDDLINIKALKMTTERGFENICITIDYYFVKAYDSKDSILASMNADKFRLILGRED